MTKDEYIILRNLMILKHDRAKFQLNKLNQLYSENNLSKKGLISKGIIQGHMDGIIDTINIFDEFFEMLYGEKIQ